MTSILNPNETICIPAESDQIVLKMISREAAIEILGRITYIRTIQAPKEKKRYEFYEEAMNQYDWLEWIKIIKTVYIRQKQGQLSETELAFAAQAKKHFQSEVSVVLHIAPDEVEKFIVKYVKDSF